MVERSELIIVCRQVGGMMQAGVDILRITRVLRAQTDNSRLLQLYDALDHDLTMGRSLADAMERAPDVWSPFIVSLVQQGEGRNDLAGAFLSAADYLQKEAEVEASVAPGPAIPHGDTNAATPNIEYPQIARVAPVPVFASSDFEATLTRLQGRATSVLWFLSALFWALAFVWFCVEIEWLPRRWASVALFSVAAFFFCSAALWLQRRVKFDSAQSADVAATQLSYDGQSDADGANSDQSTSTNGTAPPASQNTTYRSTEAPRPLRSRRDVEEDYE